MTIVGTFLDASDEPRAGTIVRFEPEDCPQPDGLGVITAPHAEEGCVSNRRARQCRDG